MLAAGVWVAFPLLAFLQARHAAPEPRSRCRIAARLLLVIGGWFVLTELVRAAAFSRIEAFRAPGVAMAPTLLAGDYFLVRKGSTASLLSHGQLVAFERNGSRFIYRIAGLPTDTLRMLDGVLHRNGAPVYEPYVAQASNTSIDSSRYQPPLTRGDLPSCRLLICSY